MDWSGHPLHLRSIQKSCRPTAAALNQASRLFLDAIYRRADQSTTNEMPVVVLTDSATRDRIDWVSEFLFRTIPSADIVRRVCGLIHCSSFRFVRSMDERMQINTEKNTNNYIGFQLWWDLRLRRIRSRWWTWTGIHLMLIDRCLFR